MINDVPSGAAAPPQKLLHLREAWAARWPHALAPWSKFTRLNEPRWCRTDAEAESEGLTRSFAMIRLADQAIVVNLSLIEALHWSVSRYCRPRDRLPWYDPIGRGR